MTGKEINTVRTHAGDDTDSDPNVITYYYDYFGFEVKKDDPKEIVQRVVSHANNYSNLRPDGNESSYGQVGMKNLTTFSKDGKEVGRMYYFLEGDKKPLVITAPPEGSYKSDHLQLDYKGNGAWLWITYFDDGSIARKVELQDHMMNGKAIGFHSANVRSFVAHYKKMVC